MPTIVREDHDNLNVTLTLNIPVEDYEPKFKEQLSKYRKNAHLKGFRKGKTPLSVVKKMYGKSVLVDIINQTVQDELDTFLKEADFDIIGNPIANEEQEQYEFDVKELRDFTFKFDVGLAPEFEIQGLEDTAFTKYDPIVPDSMVEDDLKDAQKRLGEQVSVDDEIQEEDIIKLQADEMEDGAIKENGYANEFSVSYDELTDEAKEIFKGKKKGDLVQFNIFNLSEGKDEAFVRKYFLDVNEDAEEEAVIGNDFQAVITDVTRLQPAELDEEFFEDYFGLDQVANEQEAKDKMRENIKRYYERQGDALLYKEIRDTLLEKNQMEFPEEFLKRWMVSSGNLPEDKKPEEEMEGLKEGLTWNLIKGKLSKRFNVKVTEPEVRQRLRMQIVSYFGGQDFGSLLDDYVEKMMENEQQFHNAYNEVLADKLFNALKEVITTNETSISVEELEEIMKKEQEKNQPAPEETASEATEEEVTSEENLDSEG